MKDYDNLINRFDEIQDLSVSEEIFGAYLEGNLDLYEMENVSKTIQDDELLRTISEDIMLSSIELTPSNLLDIEMGNNAVTYGFENENSVNTDYGMLDSEENVMEYESHIEDYETVESNDSIENSPFDHDSFELPEIPFFDIT